MNIKKSIIWRVYISFAFVCIFGFCVVSQIFKIQTIKGHYWKQLADSLTTYYQSIQPMRGNIYASDGSLLATSVPIYEARMDVSKKTIADTLWKKNIDSLSWCLSNFYHNLDPDKYSDKTPAGIKQELNATRNGKKSGYFLILRELTHTRLKELRSFPLLRLGQYKGGFIVEQKSTRKEPFFPSASRTIGYKVDNVKPVGLEGGFDRYLAGKTGQRLIQKVAGNQWIPINDQNEVEPQDGQDIVTTLDVNFQDVTENALLKALEDNDADHGCAVVMEVKTGHIKAIANLSRNEDKNGNVQYLEELNTAIQESTEPGSTFKLVSTMAMLEYGGLTPNTTVDTKGGETIFFDRTMRDSHKGGYGVVSLKKAFAVSSNVGISTLAYQAFGRQPRKFTDFIAKLKINKPLNLPITGEGDAYFKTPSGRDWNGTTLPWMSIGYELRVTPLQILTLYNAVANNGVMVKPQFVREIKSVGKVVKEFKTEIINPSICSHKTLSEMQEMLESVVEEKYGTAHNIHTDEYKIAGKTGTAQVANDEGGYDEQKSYQASFVGYFPANQPMYSIIVVINKPSKGFYYAASVAAPAFKEIADKIYSMTASTRSYASLFDANTSEPLPLVNAISSEDLKNILPYTNVKSPAIDNGSEWLKVNSKEKKVEVKDYSLRKDVVPDVTGMVLSDALYILENTGLRVKFNGKGKVKEQSISAGSKFLRDETIEITLE